MLQDCISYKSKLKQWHKSKHFSKKYFKLELLLLHVWISSSNAYPKKLVLPAIFWVWLIRKMFSSFSWNTYETVVEYTLSYAKREILPERKMLQAVPYQRFIAHTSMQFCLHLSFYTWWASKCRFKVFLSVYFVFYFKIISTLISDFHELSILNVMTVDFVDNSWRVALRDSWIIFSLFGPRTLLIIYLLYFKTIIKVFSVVFFSLVSLQRAWHFLFKIYV